MSKTYCPRCWKEDDGQHLCSRRSPSAGSVEYERMVDAGERAALRSEFEMGQQYSEESAFKKLSWLYTSELDPTARENNDPITVDRDTTRYLISYIERLRKAEQEMIRLRQADFARRSAESKAGLSASLSGTPCPTCTKPLPEGTL